MVRTSLTLIGYWVADEAPFWPDPHAFVDPSWDVEERELVEEYLGRGFISRAYMGFAPCRMCGINNGSLELTDGTYVWPEGLLHYVVDHDVRLPTEFVAHVAAQTEAHESATHDDSWWRRRRGD